MEIPSKTIRKVRPPSIPVWQFYNLKEYAYNYLSGARHVGRSRGVLHGMVRYAGYCAAFYGLSSALESAMVYARGGKEDHWNRIISGAAAFGVLEMRRGLRVSAYSALGGGCMIALLEVMENKKQLNQTKILEPPTTHQPGRTQPSPKFQT